MRRDCKCNFALLLHSKIVFFFSYRSTYAVRINPQTQLLFLVWLKWKYFSFSLIWEPGSFPERMYYWWMIMAFVRRLERLCRISFFTGLPPLSVPPGSALLDKVVSYVYLILNIGCLLSQKQSCIKGSISNLLFPAVV